MVYKRGTPEYDLWKETPTYDLWRARLSMTHKGRPRLDLRGKCHSAEVCAKNSAAKTGERNPMYGKCHNAKTRAKMSAVKTGERHPFYGKHHSVETRAKMSASQSGERHYNYGKHRSAATKRKISASLMGRPRPDLRGPNSPYWRGGVSFEPYPVGWTNLLRETIRKRDDYTCVLCKKVQTTQRHPIHHINYDKEDLRPENLITLCRPCHRKTNHDREYWTNLFQMIYVPDFPKERIMKDESCC